MVTLPLWGDRDEEEPMPDYAGDDHTPRTAEGSSRDAGEYLSRSEETRRLKREVWASVQRRGRDGMTVKEFSARAGVHHGQVSSAFSTMHQTGALARLKTRRARYEVYVLPEHVDGRDTREHASIVKARRRQELIDATERAEAALDGYPQLGLSPAGERVETALWSLIEAVDEQTGRQ